MTASLSRAMRLLESDDLVGAESAFAALVGPSHDGVIARFRRAECLSRLLRHDEAVAEAQAARRDAPDQPSTGMWLAWVLAESGDLAGAAAVPHPPGHDEFTGPVSRAFHALDELATALRARAGGGHPIGHEGDRLAAAVHAILDGRHAPIHSLALRVAETQRIASEVRWPDAPAAWFRWACLKDRREYGLGPHPEPPRIGDPSKPTRAEKSAALRWIQEHAACADAPHIVAALRSGEDPHDALDVLEAEMGLAWGRLDAVDAVLARVRAGAKADELGSDHWVTATRLAQLRDPAAFPSELAGYADAQREAKDEICWLTMVSALAKGDAAAARRCSDRLGDPSHPEYVEGALARWIR